MSTNTSDQLVNSHNNTTNNIRYFDIGVNFTDSMFKGIYNGKTYHKPDLEDVILRAKTFNVQKLLLTGSNLQESKQIISLAGNYPGYLYTTVGVHPCCVDEINFSIGDEYFDELKEIAIVGKKLGIVKAFGEIGLDYDRLNYSSKSDQIKYFKKQLDLAIDIQLPLFLHMRSANDDFIEIVKPYLPKLPKGGVVHSFTGTLKELNQLLELGFYIGVNGCSLKTEENLKVVKEIPLNKLLVETDAPWCEIRKSHAGYKYLTSYPNETYPQLLTKQSSSLTMQVDKSIKLDSLLPLPLLKKEHYTKYNPQNEHLIGELASPLIKSRNEPVHIGQVVEIISKVKEIPIQEIVDNCWTNSFKFLELDENDHTFDNSFFHY
ncbi:hypothetical protein WICMUC_001974 [Wickerhamomyces mucosus]|uniref:Uncharacterized protein n=1 Tax=Wickerhamomyces mucosus TaxID=1378264 RepID=A0A9P8PRG6_9ASCO|nr:hypothetical protein WICMUC_001974 [Wickerhamomyces mucosus]